MEINTDDTVQEYGAADGDQFTSIAEKQGMGKEQFLQLLTAQLAHQDPMNPLEDKDFVAQLAQFSMLEQSVTTNKYLDMLGMSVGALVNAQLPSLIGKEIVALGDTVTVHQGQSTPIRFELQDDATDVTVQVLDGDGNVVRTMNLGPQTSGQQVVDWDGLDDNGNAVPEGGYKIEVHAKNDQGSVSTKTNLSGRVDGLDFSKGYAELMVGEVRVRPADIVEVHDAD